MFNNISKEEFYTPQTRDIKKQSEYNSQTAPIEIGVWLKATKEEKEITA